MPISLSLEGGVLCVRGQQMAIGKEGKRGCGWMHAGLEREEGWNVCAAEGWGCIDWSII